MFDYEQVHNACGGLCKLQAAEIRMLSLLLPRAGSGSGPGPRRRPDIGLGPRGSGRRRAPGARRKRAQDQAQAGLQPPGLHGRPSRPGPPSNRHHGLTPSSEHKGGKSGAPATATTQGLNLSRTWISAPQGAPILGEGLEKAFLDADRIARRHRGHRGQRILPLGVVIGALDKDATIIGPVGEPPRGRHRVQHG